MKEISFIVRIFLTLYLIIGKSQKNINIPYKIYKKLAILETIFLFSKSNKLKT